MHIFFSGIGGSGIGPLALIAKQAGFEVSGSDKQSSSYTEYLLGRGLDVHIGQSTDQIAAINQQKPIDWFVYSSALSKEQANHPELVYVQNNRIKSSKRDEFLNYLLLQKNLKLIAVSGTHGKTTTTAMMIWLLKNLGVPVSYSVGAKLSFGQMGHYDPASQYFIYECDEYDRNFLSFSPYMSVISGIDWDHADIYPTRQDYNQAFWDFISQSQLTVIWQSDASKLALNSSDSTLILDDNTDLLNQIKLAGLVNRKDAALVISACNKLLTPDEPGLYLDHMNQFPGVSRRFEALTDGLYTDYAHTPQKIAGALQLAHEQAGDNVVVIYEGLHNTRQHFIKDELGQLFKSVKKLYVVPSYLAREDQSLDLLSPDDICKLTGLGERAKPADKNYELKQNITDHLQNGDLVIALTAGGGGSLDEWLRSEFKPEH